MAARSRTEDQVKAALRAAEEADATPEEKTEMLMQIAMGLQTKPQAVEDLEAAVGLYRVALDLCPPDQGLFSARIRARLGTALMAMPADGSAGLEQARDAFETALGSLTAEGLDEEIAEAEMNLGLALQNLASLGKGRIQDAISAYQRALRTFDRQRHQIRKRLIGSPSLVIAGENTSDLTERRHGASGNDGAGHESADRQEPLADLMYAIDDDADSCQILGKG